MLLRVLHLFRAISFHSTDFARFKSHKSASACYFGGSLETSAKFSFFESAWSACPDCMNETSGCSCFQTRRKLKLSCSEVHRGLHHVDHQFVCSAYKAVKVSQNNQQSRLYVFFFFFFFFFFWLHAVSRSADAFQCQTFAAKQDLLMFIPHCAPPLPCTDCHSDRRETSRKCLDIYRSCVKPSNVWFDEFCHTSFAYSLCMYAADFAMNAAVQRVTRYHYRTERRLAQGRISVLILTSNILHKEGKRLIS